MSSQRHGVERLRAALLAVQGDATQGEGGPDVERVWQAVSGELPPAEAHDFAARAVEDPELALVWRLARELAAGEEESSVAEVIRLRRRRWPIGAALAAAAVVVVGITVVLLAPSPAPDGARFRDAEMPAIGSLLSPGEARARDRLVLRWTPGAEGSLYDIVVSDAALNVIARASRLESPQYEVPATALEGVPHGGKLLWRVEVLTPNGDHLVSPTFVELLR